VRYRVAQWATGNIGTRALRQVIRHPQLDLAGVLVYDPAKDGVDAGTLCGEPTVGVTATTDRDAIVGLEADCVLYMPRALELDDVVALLASGTNVVTTRSEFFGGGRRFDMHTRKRVLDACDRGGSSVFATGSSPGFITDALPFALLSLQRRVDRLEIDEYADLSQRDSPEMLFDLMGFGKPMGPSDGLHATYLLGEVEPALSLLAEAAGLRVDAWAAHGEVAAARRATKLAAGILDEGTVAAQRNTIVGSSGDHEVVRFTYYWYCSVDVEPHWDLKPTGWRVRVDGDAPFDVALPFPMAVEDLGEATPAYTANRPVNAIPCVCAAAPGIVSVLDLPPILPAWEAVTTG
jgi:2,4-diaminopentanoate dehydrogenase